MVKSIIGISSGQHDAAIALIRNDEILFAGHAERYSRVKNDPNINQSLIDDMKQYTNGAPSHIAFYEKPLLRRTRHFYSGEHQPKDYPPKHILHGYTKSKKWKHIGHHKSHAAAGYYTSNFMKALVVVIDAIGEWDTITVWDGNNGTLSLIQSFKYPHSIGLLYSAFTERLGLKPNEHEYILMGMSAFGEPRYVDDIFDEFINYDEHYPDQFSLKTNIHTGIGRWMPDAKNEDLAASIQRVIEILLGGMFQTFRKFGHKNLVYQGGVSLNCVFNTYLTKMFDDIWIMPCPGDAGCALGAALASSGDFVEWKSPYLGHNIDRKLDIESIINTLLEDGIVGIANGRAEFGPRALGNRSLFADPRKPIIQNVVNKIKKREQFRPFAPLVLEEYASEYFDLVKGIDYSYMQYAVRCKKPEVIPAVVHKDGTSRVQTLKYYQHPNIYKLISEWFKKTDCPVLLNTSLNIKGEPLVNDWNDALRFSELNNVKVY